MWLFGGRGGIQVRRRVVNRLEKFLVFYLCAARPTRFVLQYLSIRRHDYFVGYLCPSKQCCGRVSTLEVSLETGDPGECIYLCRARGLPRLLQIYSEDGRNLGLFSVGIKWTWLPL